MAESLLVRKGGGGGLNINNFNVEETVVAGENIQKGDLIKFVVEPSSTTNNSGFEHLQTISTTIQGSGSYRQLFKINQKKFLTITASGQFLLWQFINYNEGVLTLGNSGTYQEPANQGVTFGSVVISPRANGITSFQRNQILLVGSRDIQNVSGTNRARPAIIPFRIEDNDTLTVLTKVTMQNTATRDLNPERIIYSNENQSGIFFWSNIGGAPFRVSETGAVEFLGGNLSTFSTTQAAFARINNWSALQEGGVAVIEQTNGLGENNLLAVGMLYDQITGLTTYYGTGYNFNANPHAYNVNNGYLFLAGNNSGTNFRSVSFSIPGYNTSGGANGVIINAQSLYADFWSNRITFIRTNDDKLIVIAKRADTNPTDVFTFTNLGAPTFDVRRNTGSFTWANNEEFSDTIFLDTNKFIILGNNNPKVFLLKHNNTKVYRSDNYKNQERKVRIEGIALENATAGNPVKVATI
jgi:hypothetical protein